ncbi:hypothetical protein [Glutamicibacter arilaitensis]|uniref:hypothetical protein n=1 Tax=Glutamicibacter arilaitensis TaxID=256701 RepID=UPI003FD0BBF6
MQISQDCSPRIRDSSFGRQSGALSKLLSLFSAFTVVFLLLSFLTAVDAQASSTDKPETSMRVLSEVELGSTARGVIVGGNKLTRVCSAKKCVSVPKSKVCTVGSGCGKAIYKEYKGYCSSSVGCFTYKGKNYVYTGFKPSAAQLSQARKCAAGIGVTWLGAIAGGPIGITILGVPVALWSCG